MEIVTLLVGSRFGFTKIPAGPFALAFAILCVVPPSSASLPIALLTVCLGINTPDWCPPPSTGRSLGLRSRAISGNTSSHPRCGRFLIVGTPLTPLPPAHLLATPFDNHRLSDRRPVLVPPPLRLPFPAAVPPLTTPDTARRAVLRAPPRADAVPPPSKHCNIWSRRATRSQLARVPDRDVWSLASPATSGRCDGRDDGRGDEPRHGCGAEEGAGTGDCAAIDDELCGRAEVADGRVPCSNCESGAQLTREPFAARSPTSRRCSR